MANSGSGNRKRPGTGNRRSKPVASPGKTAAERAKDRVEQQGPRPARPQNRRPQRGRRPPQRNSSARTAGIFSGTFVVLAAVIIIVISSLGSSGGGSSRTDPFIKPFPITASVENALKSVSYSQLASAGKGGTGNYSVGTIGKKASGAPIVKIGPVSTSGKPAIQYIGAEYCPYCAATRWALTIALMKFGHFTGLEQTASSPIDAYPDTHTLTFAEAKYSSNYVSFQPVEETTNQCEPSSVVPNTAGSGPKYVCANGNYKPLQSPTKAQEKHLATYDTQSWFGGLDTQGPGIPFIDFGGTFAESGALYNPQILQGATWSEIIHTFAYPSSGIGQAIFAASKQYIAMICTITHDKPGAVCNQPFLSSLKKAYR